MEQPLQVFCCYAREDQPSLLMLKRHLRPFQREGLITVQADIDVSPGEDWEQKINHYLNTAQMILLLISPDFMDSDYCYSKEMTRVMERHESGEVCVIPIILRPTFWRRAPFGKLQVLPANAEPVSGDWRTPDAAFLDVTKGIEKAVEKLLIQLQPRKIALFGYEAQGGSASVLWTDPGVFSLNENESYLKWSGTKRSLTEEEIVDHTWVKVGDHGNSFIVHFLPQGQFRESPLLDPSRQLEGSWKLIDGMLRTNIEQHENGALARYELDIFANQNASMHSGVESRNGTETAYFVLLPSRQLNTNHYDEAITAFTQLLRVNQNCAEAYKAKGNLLRDLKRYEEALAAYQQAIELKPDDMWAWYDRGDVLHRLKRYEEALAEFDHAIELDDKNALVWHHRGETLRELKQYQEALVSYKQAQKVDPKFVKSYNGMGNVLFRNLRRYEEALAAYQRAAELQPDYMWAWHNMGNVLDRLQRYEEALKAYKRTTELDPDYMWAWHNMGNILHKFHRYEEALEAYKRATEIDPAYMWAWHNKGDVLHELGRYEEALDAFDKAIERDNHVAVIWRGKGKTLQDLKRYEEALASYERALELESQYASIWTRKGEVLRALKRYEEAIIAYDKALQLESNDVDAYLGKGRVYLDLERYNEALKVYEQATNIAPNNPWTWHDKGVTLGYLQRMNEAVEAFEQAIELDPENKWAWCHKAEALTYLARQAYEKAGQYRKTVVQSSISSAPTQNELLFDGRNILNATAIKTARVRPDLSEAILPAADAYATFWAHFGSHAQEGKGIFKEGLPGTNFEWDGVWEHRIDDLGETLVMDTSDYVNIITSEKDSVTSAYICIEYKKDTTSNDKHLTGIQYLFWFVSDGETVKDGYYNLVQKATGKCLDGNGDRVYMHDPNGGDFQLWKAIEISPGTIALKHFWSGKVLEATVERGYVFQ
jgi:tetratricopeptide (TPR) repeat protein